MSEHQELVEAQPLLPRVGMVWFFIVVTLVAMALGVIRAAEQGTALAAALLFVGIFIAAFAALSGVCFTVAFLFGAMEKAVAGNQETPTSPFIDGTLPEQIIPPRPVDAT